MDWSTRIGLQRLLERWADRGAELEEVFDHIEELIRKGVSTQPAPTPDQIVPPSPWD